MSLELIVAEKPRGGGHSLIWPIQGRVAGQGMVFDLSALNRVYNFMWTCDKQGMFFPLNHFKKLFQKIVFKKSFPKNRF